MPKLNRWLITSIIEDIKELISVANEMCSWIEKVDHLSWRFPTRSARNVNAMAIVQNHNGPAGEMYILLLEIAYDRMHFVLRLVIEFMESYPFIEDFFKEVARAKRPGSMSLANVIRTLWQRLKLIPETITRNMIEMKHLENSTSRGSQASSSLSFCESCSCASRAVRNVTNMISAALQESSVSSVILTELESISADLFDKTQWGVMTKLVEAIDADLKTLLKTTSAIRDKCETDARDHEQSFQNLAVEIEKQKIEKSSLKLKIREKTDQLQAVDGQLQKLKETHTGLVEENRALTESLYETKKNLSNSEILLTVTRQQLVEMAESKVALESSIKYLHQKIISTEQAFISEKKELHKSMEFLRDEKVLREKQYHEEVKNLNEKYAGVIEKLKKDAQLCTSASSNSYSSEADTQTEEEKSRCEVAEIFIPKGDPEVDMAQQLASNEETIKKLTRQNERLSRTLKRLQEHRKVSENRTIADRETEVERE